MWTLGMLGRLYICLAYSVDFAVLLEDGCDNIWSMLSSDTAAWRFMILSSCEIDDNGIKNHWLHAHEIRNIFAKFDKNLEIFDEVYI